MANIGPELIPPSSNARALKGFQFSCQSDLTHAACGLSGGYKKAPTKAEVGALVRMLWPMVHGTRAGYNMNILIVSPIEDAHIGTGVFIWQIVADIVFRCIIMRRIMNRTRAGNIFKHILEKVINRSG